MHIFSCEHLHDTLRIVQLHIIAPQEGLEAVGKQAAHYRDSEPQMFLLYRRGHYDLLYPEDHAWASIERIT